MEKVLDDTTVSYYFIVFFMALLKATIVEVFCRLKSGKSIRLSAMPKETQYMLTMIPLCSLISCFLLIEVAKELISAQMVVLCMCIIFVIIITNYVIFLMIEKYTTVEEKQHEEEMIQRSNVAALQKTHKLKKRSRTANPCMARGISLPRPTCNTN